jgi:AcrR family transcriptional regulator
MSENSIRSIPRQARSQQTVDLILDTAADLFVQVGYQNATTNAIAEQAGISIGTLYRYYPDKDAILKALAERYYEQERQLFARVFVEDMKYLPLPIIIDRIVDPMMELYTRYPAYAHILLGSDVSTEIAAASRKLEIELLDRTADFFRLVAPHLNKERSHLLAAVNKAIVKALIALVSTSKDKSYQQKVTVEIKKMLLCYWEPVFRPAE